MVLDQYLLFAIAAMALSVARYGTYFYTIYKGQTKPHAFTWFLIGVIVSIGTFAQFELGGGPSAWALALVATTCFLIAILACFIGERNYTRSDWMALIGCLCAIPLWQITDNPVAALVLIMLIDSMAMFPTYRKSYNKPQTEPPISYGFAGMRYFLILFAVPSPSWETLMYPFFLLLADWGFGIFIVIRRAQLGYPLHEYAKNSKLF